MFEFQKASECFEKAGNIWQAAICEITYIRQSCIDSAKFRLQRQFCSGRLEICRDLISRTESSPSKSNLLLEFDILASCAEVDIDRALALVSQSMSVFRKFSRLQLHCLFRAMDLLLTSESNFRWRDFHSCIDHLNFLLDSLLPTLDRAATNKSLSLQDEENVQECVAYFEGKMQSGRLFNATCNVSFYSLSATLILFDVKKKGKSVEIKLNLFAKVVANHFRKELKCYCSTLSSHLRDQVRPIARLSLKMYVDSLREPNNEGVLVTTSARLEFYLPLLEVLSLHNDDPQNRADLEKASSKIFGICLPEYSFLEDMKTVSTTRLKHAVVNDCLQQILKLPEYSHPGLRGESIVMCLLISELMENGESVVSKLEKFCALKLLERNTQDEVDHRTSLIAAFIWEQSQYPPPPPYVLGPLLYSLDSGFTALDNDCWHGSIAHFVYQSVPLPLYAKECDKCLSPQLFLKLVEKYTVLLVSVYRNYRNVILPSSLFEDVLCRRNKAYVNDIEQNSITQETSPIRRQFVANLANRLCKLLESIVKETTGVDFFRWYNVNRTSPMNKIDLKQHTATFTLRIIILLDTVIANCFGDFAKELCNRYNDLVDFIKKTNELSAVLSSVFPEKVTKTIKTKTNNKSQILSFR